MPAIAALAGLVALLGRQTPAVRPTDEKVLRDYVGVYQREPNAFLYLQLWNELTGTTQLTAFDESGELRT